MDSSNDYGTLVDQFNTFRVFMLECVLILKRFNINLNSLNFSSSLNSKIFFDFPLRVDKVPLKNFLD